MTSSVAKGVLQPKGVGRNFVWRTLMDPTAPPLCGVRGFNPVARGAGTMGHVAPHFAIRRGDVQKFQIIHAVTEKRCWYRFLVTFRFFPKYCNGRQQN